MKLKIFVLITLILLGAISVLLIISMTNYVNTYEEWFSFMTLRNAEITLIFLCILLGVILTGIVVVVMKNITYKRNCNRQLHYEIR